MIKLNNLNYTINKKEIISDLNIEFKPNQIHTIIGPSGCGKTTILNLISGLLKPTSGQILIDNKDVTNEKPEKRKLGYVFQNHIMFDHLNVFSNVSYPLNNIKTLSREEIKSKTDEILKSLEILDLSNNYSDEISGGQKQRVAIARELVKSPKVILMDEPFANLDNAIKNKLRIELKRIQKEFNLTILFVTHDQQEAMMLGDSMTVVKNGKVVAQDKPESLYKQKEVEWLFLFLNTTKSFIIDKGIFGKDKLLARAEEIYLDTKGVEVNIIGEEYLGREYLYKFEVNNNYGYFLNKEKINNKKVKILKKIMQK